MNALLRCRTALLLCISMVCQLLLSNTAHALPPGVRAVDHAAAGKTIDGQSWSTAFRTLQDALEFAAAHPGQVTQIWVARGTYDPLEGLDNPPLDHRFATFKLINGVGLYGGFLGAPGFPFGRGGETSLNQRDPERHPTILTGNIGNPASALDNCFTIVYAGQVNRTAVLNGFTITQSQSGCGLQVVRSSPTVVRCVFIANRGAVGGAAVQITTAPAVSNPFLVNCSFLGNEAIGVGGAISLGLNCGATLINCVFSGNSAGQVGGAIYGTPSVPLNLINCTFSGNRTLSSGAALSIAPQGAPVNVVNCILWGNKVLNPGASLEMAEIGVLNNPELVSVTFSCIQGLAGFDIPGSGNTGSNPLFLDPVGPDWQLGTHDEDFHVAVNSPSIDAGTKAAELMTDPADLDDDGNTIEPLPWDLAKSPRIVGAVTGNRPTVDMGAYESPTAARKRPAPGLNR